MAMSWEKEIREYKARMRAIKAAQREIEKEYDEMQEATVKVYMRAGRGFEDPGLEEELEDLRRQEQQEINALYSKPKKGWYNDDEF